MGSHTNRQLAARVADLPTPTERWPRWLVSGGGLGFLRPAPGSWGTAGPALLYWLALALGFDDPGHSLTTLPLARSLLCLALALLASILMIQYGRWACAYFHQPDPDSVVLDEFAGFWLTVAFVPTVATGWLGTFLFTAALYLLFRLTDTLKLPPCRALEKLPWGWGILLDDIASALQANLLAQLVIRFAFP